MTKWDPKFESVLDVLSASAIGAAAAATLDPAKRKRLQSLNGAAQDILAINLIYLAGFAEIQSAGALAAIVPDEVRKWVATVSVRQSGTRVAGLFATSVCSVLEDFLVDIGNVTIDASVVARLSVSRKLDTDPSAAKQQLLRAVKPSVKADGAKWLAAVEEVFGVTPDPAVQGTLLPMIRFRNEFVHDPPKAFLSTITGEEIKCWVVSALLLAHDVTLAS